MITKLNLEPARESDRKKIHQWLLNWNNGSVYDELPTYDEYCQEEDDYFYDGSEPEKGMYYIIKSNSQEVGCISYTCYHLKPKTAELDIWLKDESVTGNGYGMSAITLLCEDLHIRFNINTFLIRPSKKNLQAIHVYKKCSFIEMTEDISEYMKPEFLEEFGPGDCGIEGTENLILHYKG